ncbi:MAG: trimethylamine methyltransferase family protein, partial [Anaerolineae bacterium]|nr:trimethylamine methyltransferase family protein [Anaerolineae bacterium]
NSYGLSTSATQLDSQCAYERLANAFTPALAGVDILSGVGMMGGLAGSLEMAVIDDEIIGLMKHIIAGYEVSEETLAFDVMKEVIPGDGVFLGERHTVRQMRKGAIWVPTVGKGAGGSTDDGGGGVVVRANARVKEILQTYHVEPLPEDVSRQLDEILARAHRELVGM